MTIQADHKTWGCGGESIRIAGVKIVKMQPTGLLWQNSPLGCDRRDLDILGSLASRGVSLRRRSWGGRQSLVSQSMDLAYGRGQGTTALATLVARVQLAGQLQELLSAKTRNLVVVSASGVGQEPSTHSDENAAGASGGGLQCAPV